MNKQEQFQVNLSGQVAVVTGATSGIGKATAISLAQAGAKVFMGDIQLRPENDDQFNELGIQQQTCDVQNLEQLQSLIDGAAETGGRLDIMVNNAGVTFVKQISEVSEQEWDRVLDTNLKSAFFGTKFALPHLLKSGGGSVVNTSSNAGILPRAHDPVYSISKLALVGLTKSLALCHSKDKVRVNCVCPGPVDDTEIMEADLVKADDRNELEQKIIAASPLAHAHRRMIHPEEVAKSILYLVSEAAEMVTGTALTIDGGKSLGVPPA